MLYYIKRQWRSHRFKTCYDKQQTLWRTSTLAFYTTSVRRNPRSANISNSYHHHQHTPSTYLPPPPPVTLHHADHEFAHHHHLPTTQMTHLHLPLLHNLHQLASASSHHHHHHSTHMQTGIHGMAKQIVAWWSSKAILDFAPIGFLSHEELDSPSSSAKPDGKNYKICSIYMTTNSLLPRHQLHILRGPPS